jgi:hypothetical protein
MALSGSGIAFATDPVGYREFFANVIPFDLASGGGWMTLDP